VWWYISVLCVIKSTSLCVCINQWDLFVHLILVCRFLCYLLLPLLFVLCALRQSSMVAMVTGHVLCEIHTEAAEYSCHGYQACSQ